MVRDRSFLILPTDTTTGADIDGLLDVSLRILLAFRHFDIAHGVIPLKHGRTDGDAAVAVSARTQIEHGNSRHRVTSSPLSLSVAARHIPVEAVLLRLAVRHVARSKTWKKKKD
jgi:hypothetical protein